MKKIFFPILISVSAGVIIFTSCNKEKPLSFVVTPPPPPSSPDTLSGKEFLFNDLPWVLAGPGAVAEEEIWIGVENRVDLFSNFLRPMEVAIKFDTSAVWMTIPKWNWPAVPANNGYFYVVYSIFNSFYVESYPINFRLIGRRASLKIKFL